MRMGGFWVVLNLVGLLFVVSFCCFWFIEKRNGLIGSIHSEAFLQTCRAEECSITWSILLYSSPYIRVTYM
jgi:hypothetical protein